MANEIEFRAQPTGSITYIFDENITSIEVLGQTITSSGQTSGSEGISNQSIKVNLKDNYVLNTITTSNENFEIKNITENTFECIDHNSMVGGGSTTLTLTSKLLTSAKKVRLKDNEGNILHPETSVEMVKGVIPYVWYGAGEIFNNIVYTKDGVEQYSTMIEPFAGDIATRRVKNKNAFKVKVIVKAGVIGEVPQIVEINPNEESDYYNSKNYSPEIWAVMKID